MTHSDIKEKIIAILHIGHGSELIEKTKTDTR